MKDKTPTSSEVTHLPYSNGTGGTSRSAEPRTLWGFAWRLLEKYGFQTLVCFALAYYIYFLTTSHQDAAKQAHVEFREAMSAQTSAVREATVEQKKQTEALIRLDSKIEAHLREDDRRHRGR